MKKFLVIFLITTNYKKYSANKSSVVKIFECHENDLNKNLTEFQRDIYQEMDIDTKFDSNITITNIVII